MSGPTVGGVVGGKLGARDGKAVGSAAGQLGTLHGWGNTIQGSGTVMVPTAGCVLHPAVGTITVWTPDDCSNRLDGTVAAEEDALDGLAKAVDEDELMVRGDGVTDVRSHGSLMPGGIVMPGGSVMRIGMLPGGILTPASLTPTVSSDQPLDAEDEDDDEDDDNVAPDDDVDDDDDDDEPDSCALKSFIDGIPMSSQSSPVPSL